VARLALESGAPVIPCAMLGTFQLMPSGKLIPRLRYRPGVRFGKPLDFSRYAGLESDRLVLRAVTDEIMYAIMALASQEYVDEDAQRAKERLKAEHKAERLVHASPRAAPAGSPAALPVRGHPAATGNGAGGAPPAPRAGRGAPGPAAAPRRCRPARSGWR